MDTVDLIVVGDAPAAESVENDAVGAGLDRVVRISGPAPRISNEDESVVVAVDDQEWQARAVAVVRHEPTSPAIPWEVPDSVADRVHTGDLPAELWDSDVLVVGASETAAELADRLARQRTGVVLARGGGAGTSLSGVTRGALLRREAERRLTVLWESRPVSIEDIGGEPMVTFDSPGTPDLVFDHVVVVDDFSSTTGNGQTGPVWRVGDGALPAGKAWETIRRHAFPEMAAPVDLATARTSADELRHRHYNATITYFERSHSDLWLIRVRPDHGDVSHEAGQYASLGLGYWEPRADGARDPGLDRKWENLVRRSYSISSPVFEPSGYLADPNRSDSLEFYIVLVPSTPHRVPALTPRLALKGPGDRLYVGPRVVGRYTLSAVTDPEATVVFLATGTGEAPHNAMATELLRKGHTGPIVSVVSVRYRVDLAYLDTHRRLEQRFSNYHYLPLVTRDPEVEKLYVQDVVRRSLLADRFGVELDPATTHVYLCGNPAMIGAPQWDDDVPRFPDPVGTCQLLSEAGFDLDRHGHVGNVHTEKYW